MRGKYYLNTTFPAINWRPKEKGHHHIAPPPCSTTELHPPSSLPANGILSQVKGKPVVMPMMTAEMKNLTVV